MAKKHTTLRTEKNCLNCGHHVEERYCTHCGQENLVIHDSTIHMIVHYVQDLFHYDGRLWHTMRNLVQKPGQIPLEYIEGKRRNNIEPIKLYVFASTVFFLFFFIVADGQFKSVETGKTDYSQRLINLENEKDYLGDSPDTVLVNQLQANLFRLDTTLSLPKDTIDETFGFQIEGNSGLGKWLEKRMTAKAEKMRREHAGNETRIWNAFFSEFMHKLPQLLFLSMPFFALLLWLLYINRSNRNYVEHFIFSTYHYSYLFLVITAMIVLDMVIRIFSDAAADAINGWLIFLTFAYICVYLALSMKRFYGGRWGRLILRYVTLGSMFFVLMIFLIVFMFIVTAVS